MSRCVTNKINEMEHICKELNQYININKNWNSNRCNFNIYEEKKISKNFLITWKVSLVCIQNLKRNIKL
ncbi:hypothetical protein RhiirA4_485931 [Rhizophagus irregularis]|uniref:Uncharacterized protein n=1 Tax=Rhizophagus irregularis TaxID=588596 RepID=A0A2I1HQU5_9GLOM|nr:hypothetical protein RhiirA4_485931 [Rhizophagus irregularis]